MCSLGARVIFAVLPPIWNEAPPPNASGASTFAEPYVAEPYVRERPSSTVRRAAVGDSPPPTHLVGFADTAD